MILMIDNYDSFTFNLVQALQAAGADVRVVRNDEITRDEVAALADDPAADLRGHRDLARARATRARAGVSVDTIRVAADRRIPLLGVCLGMQSMGAAMGRLDRPRPDARPRRGDRRSSTTAPGCSRACPRRSRPRATTR